MGGIAGFHEPFGAATSQINYNQSNGLIYASTSSYFGGIVGSYVCSSYLISSNGCELSYNTNNSGISGSNNLGGIIGDLYNEAHLSMEHNTNNGAVSGAYFVGGMIGYVYADKRTDLYSHSLDAQYNESNAKVSATDSEAGGIVGRMESYSKSSGEIGRAHV